MREKPPEYATHISDAGFFVLRTPTLPAEDFLNWTVSLSLDDSSATPELGTEALESAWQRHVCLLRDRLRSILDRPEVARALFVASAELKSGLRYWRTDPDSKKGLQTERTLVRYFSRMCTRATPFGLFAGCTLGRATNLDNELTSLTLQPRRSYRTTTRLDYEYLFELTCELKKHPRITRELRYWVNSSVHRHGNYWHYIDVAPTSEGAHHSHQLVKVEANTYLDSILERCFDVQGARFSEIVDLLATRHSIAAANAESFVQEVVDSQILVPALSPLVTGDSALDDIIGQLRESPSARSIATKLSEIKIQLAAMDRIPLDAAIADYSKGHDKIVSDLEELPAKLHHNHVYQVDMIKPPEKVVLTEPVMNAIRQAVDATCRLAIYEEPHLLTDFRKALIERYEREPVPLLDVLDEDSGIGFGPNSACQSSVIRALPIAGPSPEHAEELHPLHMFLLDRITKCFCEGSNELQLDAAEIPIFNSKSIKLPSSMCVSVELIASSAVDLCSNDFKILLNGINGPAGARTLARFCHAEPELKVKLREYLRTEQQLEHDAVLAEIVYLPEGRYGNVLSRPVLREYEIVYLGRSGAPVQYQIPASDLLVTVNEHDEICLISQILGKRIIPRLSSAQNFHGLFHAPVYRFLTNLQFQNGTFSLNFSWGPLNSLPHLPRVSVGRVVLSVAQWRLDEQEIGFLANSRGWQRFSKVRELRRRRSLPRFIELVQSNQELFVDLDNGLSVDAFVHALLREQEATLREVFPSPDDLCVRSEEGRFWHELHVPLLNQSMSETAQNTTKKVSCNVVHPKASGGKRFALGSEWMYLKLYGGWWTIDRILNSHLGPFIETLDESIFRWFFIRYADPKSHLRIRIHAEPHLIQQELQPAIIHAFRHLLDSGILWRLQFDTYVREAQRYGGLEGICASEDIFRADSDSVLALLKCSTVSDDIDVRWKLALMGVDLLLNDCGLDLSEKLSVVKDLRDACYPPFPSVIKSRRVLGDLFRVERRWFEGLRSGSGTVDGGAVWELARDVFGRRTRCVRHARNDLDNLNSSGLLCRPISALASSYVHMHVNRMIPLAFKEHELAIYDFLYRLYSADAVRAGAVAKSEVLVDC